MTQDLLQTLPPASQNNARSIVRKLCERFKNYPSERLARRIEDLTGWTADWSDADYGEGPRGLEE